MDLDFRPAKRHPTGVELSALANPCKDLQAVLRQRLQSYGCPEVALESYGSLCLPKAHLERIFRGKTVLELGAGSGRCALKCLESGAASVVAVDAQFAPSQESCPNLHWVYNDITEFFDTGDAIGSFNVDWHDYSERALSETDHQALSRLERDLFEDTKIAELREAGRGLYRDVEFDVALLVWPSTAVEACNRAPECCREVLLVTDGSIDIEGFYHSQMRLKTVYTSGESLGPVIMHFVRKDQK